jgi:glycine betaine/proline transport system substrate-binding protein
MKRLWAASLCALSVSSALAAEPATCRDVRFADVGWTDIAATTGLASTVLEGLGYKPTKTIASVPITFAGVKSKQIDVFLGYWSPTMDPMIDPF